jgi:hypothetical protein
MAYQQQQATALQLCNGKKDIGTQMGMPHFLIFN